MNGRGIGTAALCLAVSILSLTVSPAMGQELLPDNITGELVLKGEYLLEKGVTVAREGTLILEAGTRLKAGAGGALTIHGTLRVNGTKEQPVEIFSPEGTTWKGITLLSEARGVVNHGRIARAETGISVLAARIQVSDSTMAQCKTAIHLVREAVADIKGIRFTDNKVGLAVEMRSGGEVSGCVFEGSNVALGIASGGTPVVRGNRFEGNDLGMQVLQRYPGKIEGNIFKGNKVGVRLYQNGPDTAVERNRFEDNSDAAIISVSFTSPTIRNNYMTGGKYGIYANQFSSPVIEDNVIRKMEEALHLNKKNISRIKGNIVADSGIGIFCDFSSYPLIRENLFSGNEAHLKLGRFQSSNWESRAGSKNLVLETAARQGSRNPKLGQGPNEFPEAVDATGNWWDKKTLTEMTEKGEDADISTLYDGHDLPEVTYEGFGEESYSIDKILYLPALDTEPETAGLKGWKGTADELVPGL